MFNHYTPQSDGSYQRSTRPDPARRPAASQPSPSSAAPRQAQSPPAPGPQNAPSGLGSFFRQLLPRQPDTADLLILMLVLLCRDGDDPSPILTLALYFLL